MAKMTDEKVMAYVDGELTPEDRSALERRLASDRQLQCAVANERLLRSKFAETYDPTLAEEVPQRLLQLLERPNPQVLPFRRPRIAPAGWRWQHLTAMAASLALALFLGNGLLSNDRAAEDQAGFRITKETAEALNVQLASTQSANAPVQIGVSFIGPEGQPCRTFGVSEGAGLACRSGNEWKLELFAPGTGSSGTEFQRAESGSTAVMSKVQELIAGEPMDGRQERQARDAGWPATGN
jgi:hypothetical protein